MERLVDKSIGAKQFTSGQSSDLPTRAAVVVVGGGVIGASIAYHLAERGVSDVLLLEANVLGSGTTWHAAGLVNGARSSVALTELSLYGRGFYERLEDMSGIDVNWCRSGSLSLARTSSRVEELSYQHDVATLGGVASTLIESSQVKEHWPLVNPAGVLAGLLIPGDGHVNPGHAAVAIAKLAHERGVDVREGVRVCEVVVEAGRATGVRTDAGVISAEQVVLACGLWTRELGKAVAVPLPLYPAEHIHVRSNPIEGVVPEMPVLRDLDSSYYIRHEAGRLLVGAFEPDGKPRAVREIPSDGFAEFDADWDHFSSIRHQAERTVPSLQPAGYDRFLNAPESFTPDANFLLGETGQVSNLYVAAGMNSQGIIFAPGVGKELAAWITEGTPQFDASAVDVRRFSRHQSNGRYLHARTKEGLGRLYAMHWPHLQMSTARNVRRTPLHARLSALGASFGELNGWERAMWYGDPGSTPVVEYSYARANWFEHVATEHRAVREGVALFDLSPFAKFEIAGPQALDVVQRIFTSDMDVAVGRAVYTLALNQGGGIELDGTVTRVALDRFLVVTPSATLDKTLSILRRGADGYAAAVFDATAAYATIAVSGPRSRELMERVSPEDWSNEAQPYLHGREVEVADGFAYALRVSFVGELGYELYVSSDLAVNVFDALWQAGQDLGVKLAGYHALDTLRAEKGFRHLGHDMGPNDDPRSSGLWFTVDLEKGDFVGRDAIAKSTPSDLRHRTVYFALSAPEANLVHDEAILCDGRVAGRVLSGNYGHSLGRAVGLAAVDPALDTGTGDWEIVCSGRRWPVAVGRRPFMDPSGERMRG